MFATVLNFLLDDSQASEFCSEVLELSACSIITGRLNDCGTLRVFRNVGTIILAYTSYEEGTEYSETSVHKIQTPGNHLIGRIKLVFIYHLYPKLYLKLLKL